MAACWLSIRGYAQEAAGQGCPGASGHCLIDTDPPMGCATGFRELCMRLPERRMFDGLKLGALSLYDWRLVLDGPARQA